MCQEEIPVLAALAGGLHDLFGAAAAHKAHVYPGQRIICGGTGVYTAEDHEKTIICGIQGRVVPVSVVFDICSDIVVRVNDLSPVLPPAGIGRFIRIIVWWRDIGCPPVFDQGIGGAATILADTACKDLIVAISMDERSLVVITAIPALCPQPVAILIIDIGHDIRIGAVLCCSRYHDLSVFTNAHGPVAAVEGFPVIGRFQDCPLQGARTVVLDGDSSCFIIVCRSRARYIDIAFAIYPDGHTFIIEIGQVVLLVPDGGQQAV